MSQRLKRWQAKSDKPVKREARPSWRDPLPSPVGESQSNGIIVRAVGLVARIPPDARILCWLVEFAAYLLNRCDMGSDGKTPLQRLHGRRDNTPILEFGEPSQQEEESGNRDSIPECSW